MHRVGSERAAAGWWGSRNRGDLAPGLVLLIHQLAVGGCGEAMATWAEVVADGAEVRQEALRPLGRLEAVHAPLR